ncbi:MAG TPA: VIT1/CCC1 transporter family protein [Acidimicrobiales bacterium]|nr:VIT1/CCC1 transporter family protein [Acidimicrobiales bacterium]
MNVHFERHRGERAGWLRAAVLGADDGILSTASLMLGVSGSGAGRAAVLTAGIAGLTAGAAAMAIGEFVSVSSQSDAEAADRARESRELSENPGAELAELRRIYVRRGLSEELAAEVADALHAADPLGAHLRDELGQSPATRARPLQASLVSAFSFALGAAVPVLAAALASAGARGLAVALAGLAALLLLGATGARLGGARVSLGMARVGLGGAAAMGITYGIGQLLGTTVS